MRALIAVLLALILGSCSSNVVTTVAGSGEHTQTWESYIIYSEVTDYDEDGFILPLLDRVYVYYDFDADSIVENAYCHILTQYFMGKDSVERYRYLIYPPEWGIQDSNGDGEFDIFIRWWRNSNGVVVFETVPMDSLEKELKYEELGITDC